MCTDTSPTSLLWSLKDDHRFSATAPTERCSLFPFPLSLSWPCDSVWLQECSEVMIGYFQGIHMLETLPLGASCHSVRCPRNGERPLGRNQSLASVFRKHRPPTMCVSRGRCSSPVKPPGDHRPSPRGTQQKEPTQPEEPWEGYMVTVISYQVPATDNQTSAY